MKHVSFSKTRGNCQTCPVARKCPNKQLEAYAAIATEPFLSEAAAPAARETREIYIDGSLVTVYKDEIEKMIWESHGLSLGLNYGA